MTDCSLNVILRKNVFFFHFHAPTLGSGDVVKRFCSFFRVLDDPNERFLKVLYEIITMPRVNICL